MFKQLQKRMQQIADIPRHKSYVPKNSGDPSYNFSELVELSKRYAADFKIVGDHQKFTIVSKSLVLKGLAVLIGVYLVGVALLAIYAKEPIIWGILVVGLIVFLLALKFGPLLFYNITVDTHTRKITVKSNNTLGFIGQWIRPGFQVDFNRFEKLSAQMKKRRSWGGEYYTTHFVNRIFIEYDQQKRPVMDFRDEVNHNIFIICLTRLIKK